MNDGRTSEHAHMDRQVKRWAAVAVILILLVATLGAATTVSAIRSTVRAELLQTMTVVLDSSNDALSEWVEHQRRSLDYPTHNSEVMAATDELLATAASGGAGDLAEHPAQRALRDAVSLWVIDHALVGYMVVSPERLVLAAARPALIGSHFVAYPGNLDLFGRALAGESVLTPPVYARIPLEMPDGHISHTASTIFAMAPIFGPDGTVKAVFAARVNTAGSFMSVFQRGRLGLTGETYAVDKFGRLASESRFTDHLREIGLIAADAPSMLNIDVRDPGINLVTHPRERTTPRPAQPLTKMAHEVTNGRSGYDIKGYRDYRGVMVLGAWTWNTDLDIGIATEIDRAEAYRQLDLISNGIYAFAAVIAFFFMVLVFGSAGILRRLRTKDAEIEGRDLQLRMILDSAGEGVIGVDATHRMTFVNPMASKILGYEPQELIGHNMHAMLHHAYANGSPYPVQCCPVFAACAESRSSTVDNEVFWHKDGHPVPVRYVSVPMSDSGRVSGAVVTFTDASHDFTERQASDRALVAARSESKAKSEYLVTISEEIRAPMTDIMGATRMLTDSPLTGDQRETIATIRSHVTSVLIMLDQVTRFSARMQRDPHDNALDFDLVELVEEVLDGRQAQVSVAEAMPVAIHADTVTLKQAMGHLVNAAYAASGTGGISVQLSVDQQVGPANADGAFLIRVTVEYPGGRRKADDYGMDAAALMTRDLVAVLGGTHGVSTGPDGSRTHWFTFRCRTADKRPPAGGVSLSRSKGRTAGTA
ncbi:PAS domain S-box protein [Gimibacter soli]|uniref:histidine kinase n=1 Tax=Gimibacter soli TaxID=3024400 RepID=A0AAE9XR37_9PROT|nr:PAS domain S-box protein [Gimibacter soli]WCL54776.1 PAS domain S-box protein [Gimibacter soli]